MAATIIIIIIIMAEIICLEDEEKFIFHNHIYLLIMDDIQINIITLIP